MRQQHPFDRIALVIVVLAACSASEDRSDTGSADGLGQGASGGSAGFPAGGYGGSAGSGGAANAAGSSGTSIGGSAGSGGAANAAGSSGTSIGGSAGGGTTGDGGSSGTAAVIHFAQDAVDDAALLPVPSKAGAYALCGTNYGKNGPCMLFLAIAGRSDETLTSTTGINIRDRSVAHMKAALTPEVHPAFVGGHTSWFDQQVPLALAVARRTPGMWNQFTTDEKRRADVLMEHCLYVANIFCNTNSNDASKRALVNVDMRGSNSGSLPNQSSAFHAFAIGAYVYFGGTSALNTILGSYDLATIRSKLKAEGFDDIESLYGNPDIQKLFDGVYVQGDMNPDPKGVRKPFDEMNTSSLEGSPPGEEHRYHAYSPVPATPPHIFMRWGNDFAVGAMPLTNVGPDKNGACGGIDFGLSNGTMPYEKDGKGMPYEFNARSSAGGPHTRTSWHYAHWGMQQYMYMLGALAALGYWDERDPAHAAALDRARRAVEIIRYVGEHKWISSAGQPSEICTDQHGDAYGTFDGSHWAEAMMDTYLFSDTPLPTPPAVP